MHYIRRFILVLSIGVLVFALGSAAAQPNETSVYLPMLTRVQGASNQLMVSAASHLGGPQDDTAAGVDITPDGSVIFAGTMPGFQPDVNPTTLLNGTSGMIVRFDATGQQIQSVTRIGARITDLEISPEGVIAVCGDFGVATLDSTASTIGWNATPGEGRRCSIGNDGTVAVLVGGEAIVYRPDGTVAGRWAVGGNAQNDIAVDSQHNQVIVTGFNQVRGNLQIPFIRAWTYAGQLRWRSFDFPTGTPNLGTADTRGERIAIGRDGKLYFAGSINGGTGASIFIRDPKDTSKSATDRIVVTDKFTNPYNISGGKMLWVARFNPENGNLELAQSILTRRSGDKGNSIGANAITADTDGTVYIAGGAAAAIANRDSATVGGVRVGPYGGDAYALVLSSDFRQRRLWVPFTAPQGGSGGAQAISVRGNTVALVATVRNGAFISHNPVQPSPGGASDAYIAVWPK